jgi:hypothetical protein
VQLGGAVVMGYSEGGLTPKDCLPFIAEMDAAGGNATMLHLPAAGLTGNSHLLIMVRNHLEIADLLIDWIEEN